MDLIKLYDEIEYQKEKQNSEEFKKTLSVYYSHIQEIVCNPNFSYAEILKTEQKYLRAFYLATFDLSHIQKIMSFLQKDEKFNVFSFHMYFIRISQEIFNFSNNSELLSEHFNSFLNVLNPLSKQKIGSTVGYAIGFLISQSIWRGIDVYDFYKNIQSTVIEDTAMFVKGLVNGIIKPSTLNEDKVYKKHLFNRYSYWNNASKYISLHLFDNIPQQLLKDMKNITITENNYKLLQKIQTFDPYFKKLLQQYSLESIIETKKEQFFNPFQHISHLENIIQNYEQVFQILDTLIPHFSENIINNEDISSLIQKLKEELKYKEPIELGFLSSFNKSSTGNNLQKKIKNLL